MARILVVQGRLAPPGGGSGVAVWTIQALCHVHTVDVLTRTPQDLQAIDAYFGTALARAPIRIRTWHSVLQALDRCLPLPHELLRLCLLNRQARILCADYDLVISTGNEADFGRPSMQYIHYPWSLHPRPDAAPEWYQRPWRRRFLQAYYAACARLGGFSQKGARTNRTLVNSHWTGQLVRKALGVESRTLYPPAALAGSSPAIPWEERESTFVMVGRISPEKRIEEAIAILEAVRSAGLGLRLVLVGTQDHPTYYPDICGLVREKAGWVELRETVTREELSDLMRRSRYGIHAMTEEHFGMAVAEMVRAGCLVWVPRGGGQVEIVGQEELLYGHRGEAVEKIKAVLGDPARQERLRQALEGQGEQFSEVRFGDEMRREVAALLERRPQAGRRYEPGPG